MKLTYIGISQFRSIGSTPVMIDLSKKITLLVGQNDGGKSNVLRGLERVSHHRPNCQHTPLQPIDRHKRSTETSPLIHLAGVGEENEDHRIQEVGSLSVIGNLGAKPDQENNPKSDEIEGLNADKFNQLAIGFSETSGRRHSSDAERTANTIWIGRGLLTRLSARIPEFHFIPQFRRIENTDKYSANGSGIVKLLAAWQHPEIGQENLKTKFDRVEKLLRQLLGRPEASLEVPPSQDKIIVRDDPMRLPHESHGTGVHQLIILAIAVLSQDNVLFGIEEPEIHLHPLLQKRFLQFLLHETGNRYVITTHSPALIAPSEAVDVIHLKMVDGVTIPTRVQTDAASLAVLEDLGIQPSDLLQANSVIWVEGPSDRIYLKRWIEILHPRLVEGIDFAIMFYGGRLLSHLSMEREEEAELRDLVKLLRINQRSALVMDSDRGDSKEALNDTKKRLIAECERNDVHCWVTDGREIENDLAARTVEAALTEHDLLEGKVAIKPFVKFDGAMARAVRMPTKSWCDYSKHKAAWAHRFAKHIEGSDISVELEKQIDALIRALCPQNERQEEE